MAQGGDAAKVEAHQISEVVDNQRAARASRASAKEFLEGLKVKAQIVKVADFEAISSANVEGRSGMACGETKPLASRLAKANVKLVHFIRHGEGDHNVAQREWRSRADFGPNGNEKWDGVTEPYTVDNDPKFFFIDAKLTEVGRQQARELQPVLSAWNTSSASSSSSATEIQIPPIDLLLTSPMRRAAETALLACSTADLLHSSAGDVRGDDTRKIFAVEAAHELGGRHTCDKRLSRTDLADFWQNEYKTPHFDFSLLRAEEDPLWDEEARETWESCAERGVELVRFLFESGECFGKKHIVLAAHSAFLLTLFNSVLEFASEEEDAATAWFGTGELRSVLLEFDASCAAAAC